MKCGAQAALAIGVGYILGRRRKMRLATMLAVGAATGGAARLGSAAVKQGATYLGKSDIAGALGPEVAEIVDTVRGDLLDAAKAAVAAAVTSRIDSLSDNLHERAEALRNPEAAAGKAGEAVGEAGKSLGRVRRRGRGAEPEEEEAEFDQDEEPEEERSKGRVRRGRPPVRRGVRSRSGEAEEPEDAYEEEDEEPAEAGEYDEEEEPDEAPAPRRRRAARSPVVRRR